ncbi:hypothetical protein D3P08_18130 [Paenibacillus nanensis]|uniref:BIG2 domain-containing protein n=1 Tax=Paenibacillus nanensis TaxID=393251 RepID=A0A3A1UU98_9BACL|nr:Ig-like domain-containing protein [Paenibacillus nanensis]RIX51001.1 hypothetical protein D3P08_18130 [Paenibacillus nanensis]
MKPRSNWSSPLLGIRKWLAAAIAFVLVTGQAAGVAYAAEETVTGIELNYAAADYNDVTDALELIVEDGTVEVAVFASISGTSSKKDVTESATWKTSNSSAVKVDKGVLTGVGKGSATITATYKGYSATVKATSDYVYDEVTIMQDGAAAPAAIADIQLGEELAFTLDGKKNGSTNNITNEATWSTSSSSIATVDEGEVTLIGTGTVTITAKYKGKSDSVKLTVTSPYKKIEMLPEPTNDLLELEVGGDDHELEAVAHPKSGGTLTVTDKAKWTSANTKVLTVEKGVLTAVAAGKTTVTVSHLGVTDTLTVVVRTPYQSIKLTPEKELHMQLHDEPIQIRAQVQSTKGEIEDITTDGAWTSSDVTVAMVSQGKVTPKAVGTTKITVAHKGISRSIEVTVYPSITKLKAADKEVDGFKGISGELPAITATTFDGSTVDVSKLAKWSVEDEDIAEIKDGKWKALALGETTLTATVQGIKTEVKLIVHLKPIKLIAESKDMSIITGKESDLPTVRVVYEDGEEADITKSIDWTTKSDNIIIMEDAMKGLEASSVTLTGTYLTKTVSVRVKIEEEIVKFVVEPSKIELNPGKSKSIRVTGYYKDGKKVSIGTKMNWASADTEIATINGTSSVKAVDVGATKVKGSYQGKQVEVPVVVTPKLKSLQPSTKAVQLSAGQSYNVTLQAIYYTGSPVTATESAVWTTSKATVATVKDGKITAVAKGSTTIKAAYGGKTVSIRVTVK